MLMGRGTDAGMAASPGPVPVRQLGVHGTMRGLTFFTALLFGAPVVAFLIVTWLTGGAPFMPPGDLARPDAPVLAGTSAATLGQMPGITEIGVLQEDVRLDAETSAAADEVRPLPGHMRTRPPAALAGER